MAIFFAIKEILAYMASIIYVGAITWLLPIIIIVAILSACGVCATGLFAAGAKTIGQLLTMTVTAIITAIPRFVRLVARFWGFVRNSLSRVMPGWAATILAWVVLIII